MSKANNSFTYQDVIDVRDLFEAQISNLKTLIESNDKNYNQRFDNVVEATKSALASADRAVSKAEMATEKRFEGVNEFRGQQADLIANFARKSEVDIQTKSFNEKITSINETVKDLELSRATLAGKATQGSVYLAYLFSTIGIIMGIIGFFTK